MTMTDSAVRQYYAMQRHTANISKADDARARRAAQRCGLWARKSRRQRNTDNFGGYQLINEHNWIVVGEKFELNAGDVVEFCKVIVNSTSEKTKKAVR